MAIEKLKINYKTQKKKKPGPMHKLKTKKKRHELKPIRPQIQHTNPEHMYLILNITKTICRENCESSWAQVSL
jgi:hypothetical protein